MCTEALQYHMAALETWISGTFQADAQTSPSAPEMVSEGLRLLEFAEFFKKLIGECADLQSLRDLPLIALLGFLIRATFTLLDEHVPHVDGAPGRGLEANACFSVCVELLRDATIAADLQWTDGAQQIMESSKNLVESWHRVLPTTLHECSCMTTPAWN